MNTTLMITAAAGLVLGFVLGLALCWADGRRLRRRIKELRAGKPPANIVRSVTRFLFITTQVCALVWVSASYGIAVYSTVVLFQPFPVEELSRQAITTLLGMSGLKVVENVFEHNEGVVFGTSKEGGTQEDHEPPAAG